MSLIRYNIDEPTIQNLFHLHYIEFKTNMPTFLKSIQNTNAFTNHTEISQYNILIG